MKLWAHQEKAIELARFKQHLALFYDLGTGKTATIIKILEEEYVKNGFQRTLIFAPLSVCAQWEREFRRFSSLPEHYFLVLTQSGKKRSSAIGPYLEQGLPCIIITNYEAIGIDDFYKKLLKFSPTILVCDESQKLKNIRSSRFKKILPLASAAKRRFLMTGTPVLNSLLDLFGQYKILDESILGHNFYVFRAKYFYDANAQWAGKQNYFPNWKPWSSSAEEVGSLIASNSIQAKKSECLDLPPLHKITLDVCLSDQQKKVYKMMEKSFVAELNGKYSIAEIAMTKILRLQQIVSGFLAPENEEASVWFDKNPRMEALGDLLDSISGDKVIIWTVFKPTYRKLNELCIKLGRSTTFLTGLESAAQKEESIQRFTKGSINTLIANPAAGGVGVNLTEAKYAIYYSKGYSLEQYLQSEARNYRGGSDQHDRITHYHLSAVDTIDEVITKALLNKKDIGDTILTWAKDSLDSDKCNW